MKSGKVYRILLVTAVAAILGACGVSAEEEVKTERTEQEVVETQEEETEVPVAEEQESNAVNSQVNGIWEAEDALLKGNMKVETSRSGYTGEGYIRGMENDDDGCVFTIEVAETGFYDLNFVCASEGGYKENFVAVDGESVGMLINESAEFTEAAINKVYLEAGSHEVEITKSWGWICIDSLIVREAKETDDQIYNVSAKLVNANATENTKRVFSYMCDIYGTDFLAGQYCDQGINGNEIVCIGEITGGKYPAVLGFDFMEYTPSRVTNGSTSKATENAIEFWKNGGIVTFCWHWNAPEKYLTDIWWKGFYTESTNIDLDAIMNGEDEEGMELLIADMDAIAEQLKILQEAEVPVLWRPLHEASGGWFWWGNCEPESYIELYRMMYERYTEYHGLNNLIWIWNGQDVDWYPGDEYVDIIGEDIYPGERVYTSQMNRYMTALDYTEANKMIVLSENGCLFDPELAIRDGAMWGFFATWSGEFVTEDQKSYSDRYTEEDMLKKVYEHEHVITLDELPDLKNYPIREE